MAKRPTDLDNEVSEETKNWVSIDKAQNPVEWSAWSGWRRREMRSPVEFEKLTVPTPFPPGTVAAAKAYFSTVQKIRRSNGWTESRAKLPSDPSAWMGEV